MPNPASSVVEHYTLATDQLIISGETFRLDKVIVANDTPASVLVLLNKADDSATEIAIVAGPAETVSVQVEGLMDTGCLIKAISADVHVTLCRSAGGV